MADWENVQPDEYKYLGCNYTPGRPYGIDAITIHHMAGNLSADDCNRVWLSAGTSANYSVDQNGHVVQHVDDGDRVWACGDGIGCNSGGNDRSISIEHANNGSNPWTVFDAAIESGAHLVAALCKFYGLGRPTWMVNVFPHSHWSATACPGELAGSQNAQYMARAQEWYDAMCNGTDAGEAHSYTPQPSAPATDNRSDDSWDCNIHYALHVKSGDWWEEVVNFNDVDCNGYAGNPNTEHDMLIAYVDEGSLSYAVHTIEDGWLDVVNHADYGDDCNGMAGIWGHTIDGVRMYYHTPDGRSYKRVWYRSQTTQREGYLAVICDDGTSMAGYTDDFAGIYGEPLDRLQAGISDGNPFA